MLTFFADSGLDMALLASMMRRAPSLETSSSSNEPFTVDGDTEELSEDIFLSEAAELMLSWSELLLIIVEMSGLAATRERP